MSKPLILVAEDDAVTRLFVTTLLSRNGFEVVECEDGESALKLTREKSPELVLSDVVMPYLDGLQLLAAIRSDSALSQTPVVVLSMKDKEEDIVRAFDLGADDYLVKPFNARELVARIKRLLKRQHVEVKRGD